MDDNDKPDVDISAHLSEKELPKPGTTITPGQGKAEPLTAPVDHAGAAGHEAAEPHDHQKETEELQSFVAEQTEPETKEPKGVFLLFLWEIGQVFLVAAAVVFFINTFLFQAYYVSGNSMNPDYHDGDYLLINKIPSSFLSVLNLFGAKPNLDVKHGDVLVFKAPESPSIFFIKRVIGLPGDRVTVKDGKVTVYNQQNPNGQVLKECYTDPAYKTQGDIDEVIEPGKLFMMGDNRMPNGSFDSRAWGQLPQGNVSGSVFFRLIPLSNIGLIGQVTCD